MSVHYIVGIGSELGNNTAELQKEEEFGECTRLVGLDGFIHSWGEAGIKRE